MEATLRFRAMGTNVHLVVVDGDAEVLQHARERIDDLERRWSRFLPDSELSQLNREAGSSTATPLSAVTFDLVVSALDAHRDTDGLFDPMILPALVAAGYDRSFEQGTGPVGTAPTTRAAIDDVMIDPDHYTVALPAGAALDLGGIGKGRAADLVIDEIIEGSATSGACINLGGDLRVFGATPDDQPAWSVGLEQPEDPASIMLTVGLADGALATSSTTRRRWHSEDGVTRHHLIDPRTGEPASTSLHSVSVIAGSAMEAEIHAKASLIAGHPSDARLPMLFVHDDGEHETFARFEDYIW